MCGISGVFNRDFSPIDPALLEKMSNILAHRGPDSNGLYIKSHIGLAHRRLSIIDLTISANQPMLSANGRYVMIYNGEIYNYRDIKLELVNEGIIFKTNSDTEVVLEAYAQWGPSCLERFNGMFAFAIFDLREDVLTLARDCYGQKPLYYNVNQRQITFCSEPKGILANSSISKKLNYQSLHEYLWYGNSLANTSMYKAINEVPSGSILQISPTQISEFKYFSPLKITRQNVSLHQAIEEVKLLVRKAVERHSISDVQTGIFLSGGIDSSTIAKVAYQSGISFKSYSVGFDDVNGADELKYAEAFARKLEVDHLSLRIKGDSVFETIEALVEAHDEPFGDAADIPLYIMSNQIKGQVKVVLQGDGGDEFFGGYFRHTSTRFIKRLEKIRFILKAFSDVDLKLNYLDRINRIFEIASELKISHQIALLLTQERKSYDPLRVMSKNFISNFSHTNPFREYEELNSRIPVDSQLIDRIFLIDPLLILKNTFLRKVDRSTMANSIETRCPFLDKDLTSFLLSIPSSLKIYNSTNKFLLKEAMKGVLSEEILTRKKSGFGVPYAFWLKNSLKRNFFEEIESSAVSGLIDKNEILKLYKEMQNGRSRYNFLLWKVFILCIWINRKASKIEF